MGDGIPTGTQAPAVAVSAGPALAGVRSNSDLAVALAPPLAVVAVAVAQPMVNPRLLFMDPADAALIAQGAHLGMMSNAGVLLTALACAAAATAALKHGARGQTAAAAAAGLAAVLSACVALDDFYRWHEVVLPRLGVSEIAVEAAYCAAGLTVWMLRDAWMQPAAARILFLALACLGLSVGIDMTLELGAMLVPASIQGWLVMPLTTTIVLVSEDAVKFIGLWLWAFCHIAAALAAPRA